MGTIVCRQATFLVGYVCYQIFHRARFAGRSHLVYWCIQCFIFRHTLVRFWVYPENFVVRSVVALQYISNRVYTNSPYIINILFLCCKELQDEWRKPAAKRSRTHIRTLLKETEMARRRLLKSSGRILKEVIEAFPCFQDGEFVRFHYGICAFVTFLQVCTTTSNYLLLC